MIIRFMLGCVLALCACSLALAEEGELKWDDGTPTVFDIKGTEGHYVQFSKPSGWDHIFSVEAKVYGQRFGDVGATNGTLVIWGPQSERTAKLEDAAEGYVIYARQQFPLKDVPEQPGWFSIPLEIVELPADFGVAVFTYSDENKGVKIGLSRSGAMSHSSTCLPDQMALGLESMLWREDGLDWMLRIKVRSTLDPEERIDPAQLSGKNFSAFDDGSCDGFMTFTRNGALLHIKNPTKRVVKRVYVYAKAEGAWFRTERSAGIFLLDSGLKILFRGALPYKNYTNEPAWHYLEFDGAPVPADFYVLVEPASRVQVKLHLGYDGSGPNQVSGIGTVGALKNWSAETPEASTNWMVRVEYE